MIRAAVFLAAFVLPGAGAAHDAFGDLGPFYASLLHPLVDPAQGLLIVAVAVLLARQPIETVRPAYAALAVCGALAVAAHAAGGPAMRGGLRATGLAAAVLGLAAVSGRGLPGWMAASLAAAVAVAAGLAVEIPPGGRAGFLAALGGAAGIALLALLVWGGVDYASRRLGRVAGAVAGAWIAAIGIMSAALPA